MVDENTKNVLLFVQTYNPVAIRKTSMSLAQRTLAATIFEKGIDPELVTPAILSGIKLFEDLCKGHAETEILNIYPKPFKASKITVKYDEIIKKLGTEISKVEISKILAPLEFETAWKGGVLEVTPPSFRSRDILMPADVIEEIARIYGYHNLPSVLMQGAIPSETQDKKFYFEDKIKDILSGFGGVELYTLSLVPKNYTEEGSLKLKNPLGEGTEYLRTSLMPSLISAADGNIAQSAFHLFEMANVYLPKKYDLPEEKLILAGIFSGYSYRDAKGTVEALLERLNISVEFVGEDTKGFSASHVAKIISEKSEIGLIGMTDQGCVYYEFSVNNLNTAARKGLHFKEISKYPSQVEDITISLPEKTKIGDVIAAIKSVDNQVQKVELMDIYKDSYTFRIEYHNNQKTLTDKDVDIVRQKVLASLKNKFGGTLKD